MSDFSEVADTPVDSLLFPAGGPQTTYLNNLSQRNIDLRSGNLIIRDANNTRIIIGLLPDGSYGFAVSKAGYNVEDGFTT